MEMMATIDTTTEMKQRVLKSRTSFAKGMSVLPKPQREAMYALYAFCREVDDIADDSPTPTIAVQGLKIWRRRIHDLFQGKANDSITAALLPAVKAYALVEEDFQAIIDGMEMDSVAIVAPDETTFDLYCDRVASAVGRVSVRIFGDAREQAMQVAHHLGRALQITNILRDVAEDAGRGRLYVPREILAAQNIVLYDPVATIHDVQFPAACRALAGRAAQHFAEADRAMSQCDARAMKPARLMYAYYGAIHKRLVKADWRKIDRRVRLPLWQKIWIGLGGGAGA